MKRLLVVVVCIIVVLPITAMAHGHNYALTPWPYGMIAWVQTPSINQQLFIDDATQAVKDVFAFWDLPVPVPDPDWASPTQTNSQGYFDARIRMFKENPSLMMQESNPFISWLRAMFGIMFPGDDPEHVMVIPYPVWSGWKIMPLTIGVFPSRELMNELLEDYTFSGRFGSVAGYTMFRSEESWTEDEQEILHLFWNVETIIISTQGDTHCIVCHELAHWASSLWCEQHHVYLFSLPRLIIKGFADYTADCLTHDDTWRVIAASWVQHGGDLESVPRPLTYEVGTSIVDLLVQEKGKDGLLEMLVHPTTDWENVISLLTPAWRESLANVQLSAEDLPMYTAVLQDLALCRRMLAPVLPQEADDIVQRLYDGQGTMTDIDRFWDLVSQTPPDPSDETWQALIARIPSFEIVQCHDSDPDIRMVRARLQNKLDKYGEKRDWGSFYTTFIEGLRTVIAHYGFQKVTDTAQ